MAIIYYTEINLICIIILLLFAYQLRYKSDKFSSENRIFNMMLWTTVVMCASDIIAVIFRGQLFKGARIIIELSNALFFETISIISFLWMIYVFTKFKLTKNNHNYRIILAIPFILISIAILLNPLTHFMFTINEENMYSRNVGVYYHWIVSWMYLLITEIITFRLIRKSDKRKREEFISLLYFIIAPAIAGIIQSMFYGITCSQIGITISLVAISLTDQNNQVITDPLTCLNNRYAFKKYVTNRTQHRLESNMFIMMIDINNFKQVNDKFGHLEGDRALVDVADVLKQCCQEANSNLFVCRYGGDEFLIAGYDLPQEEISGLKIKIAEKMEEKNQLCKYPYVLSVSTGVASEICVDSDDIYHLLRMADEAMYVEKKQSKINAFIPLSKA